MTNDSQNQRTFSLMEEIWHSITHGIGAILGIIALVFLIVYAVIYGNTLHIVSVSIYGATLIILYLSSTLYHALTHKKAKRVFLIFDYASIYLLIAGTYTPIALVTLKGTLGWILLSIVWILAILGVVYKSIYAEKHIIISTILYVVMGWLIVFFFKPLIANMALGGLMWLAAGGLAYTIGVIFFAFNRVKYFHFIWHLFVLIGSICHFFAIFFYVIPLH